MLSAGRASTIRICGCSIEKGKYHSIEHADRNRGIDYQDLPGKQVILMGQQLYEFIFSHRKEQE